jgi:hypothetical protein
MRIIYDLQYPIYLFGSSLVYRMGGFKLRGSGGRSGRASVSFQVTIFNICRSVVGLIRPPVARRETSRKEASEAGRLCFFLVLVDVRGSL